MSVRPVTLNGDGSIDVVYDETGHTGTIAAADVHWITNPDGADNHNYIVLDCPDACGGSSAWPVGGGADAVMGQQMFVNKASMDGCACGVCQPGDTSSLPEAHIRLLVNRMDGLNRWQLS